MKDCSAAMSAVSLTPGQTVNVYDGSGSVIGRGTLGGALAPVPTGSPTGDQDCALHEKPRLTEGKRVYR